MDEDDAGDVDDADDTDPPTMSTTTITTPPLSSASASSAKPPLPPPKHGAPARPPTCSDCVPSHYDTVAASAGDDHDVDHDCVAACAPVQEAFVSPLRPDRAERVPQGTGVAVHSTGASAGGGDGAAGHGSGAAVPAAVEADPERDGTAFNVGTSATGMTVLSSAIATAASKHTADGATVPADGAVAPSLPPVLPPLQPPTLVSSVSSSSTPLPPSHSPSLRGPSGFGIVQQQQQQQRVWALVPEVPHRRPIKICSDIDDTLFPNYHDRSLPSGTLYPGVLTLFHALLTANGRGPPGSPDGSQLVFVTARCG